MGAGPAAVASWILQEFPLGSSPQRLSQIIVDFGTSESWFASDAEAQEKGERWLVPLKKRLARALSDAREFDYVARFDFNPSDASYIQGYCYVTATDSLELQLAKLARVHLDHYRSEIRRRSSDDFEAVCRGILAILGCANPILTPHSDDQGLDVFGEIQSIGLVSQMGALYGQERRLSSWIVGQAKKYTIPVEAADIREFVGSRELQRLGIFSGDGRALEMLRAKPLQATHLIFLTTGPLRSGAREVARGAGVIVIGESEVAALLADHRVATVAGVYWPHRFDSWIVRLSAA